MRTKKAASARLVYLQFDLDQEFRERQALFFQPRACRELPGMDLAPVCRMLKDVAEKEVPGKLGVSGPKEYWDMLTEVAATFVATLGKAGDATVAKVKAGVIAKMRGPYPNGGISSSGIVVTGVK